MLAKLLNGYKNVSLMKGMKVLSIKKKIVQKKKHLNKYAAFSKAKVIRALPLCRKPRYVQR